jgi:hypothetical protein
MCAFVTSPNGIFVRHDTGSRVGFFDDGAQGVQVSVICVCPLGMGRGVAGTGVVFNRAPIFFRFNEHCAQVRAHAVGVTAIRTIESIQPRKSHAAAYQLHIPFARHERNAIGGETHGLVDGHARINQHEWDDHGVDKRCGEQDAQRPSALAMDSGNGNHAESLS